MNKITQKLALPGVFCLLLAGGVQAAAEEEATRTYDDLVPVVGGKMQTAFIDPDADFSVFKRVAILKPAVAFRSNWQRDQNRSRTRNINSRDMDRIKEDVAKLFEQVFTERLEAAGYAITTESGDDDHVFLMRPAEGTGRRQRNFRCCGYWRSASPLRSDFSHTLM